MNSYRELEQKAIESMLAKGHPTPFKTRRNSLRLLSLLTGFACAAMLATYGIFTFETGQGRVQNIEMWSFPFFIILAVVTFTSRKRIQAINQLEKEQSH